MGLFKQNVLAKASSPAYSTLQMLCIFAGGWLLHLRISRSRDSRMQTYAAKLWSGLVMQLPKIFEGSSPM